MSTWLGFFMRTNDLGKNTPPNNGCLDIRLRTKYKFVNLVIILRNPLLRYFQALNSYLIRVVLLSVYVGMQHMPPDQCPIALLIS